MCVLRFMVWGGYRQIAALDMFLCAYACYRNFRLYALRAGGNAVHLLAQGSL